MAVRALLDSGAYSGFMSGSHRVREIVQDAEEVLMSAVVVGELLYGFRQGQRLDQNLAELRSFLDRPYVSFEPVGPVTADRYSRIMASLRAKGPPIHDQRRLGRRTRDGDRRGPGLRRQSLRARRPGRMGERDVGLRAAGHTGGDDSMEEHEDQDARATAQGTGAAPPASSVGASQETGQEDRELGRAACPRRLSLVPRAHHRHTSHMARLLPCSIPRRIRTEATSASRSRCARAVAVLPRELDHRLAINVARAMGPEALRRAFTLENLHWLCGSCHRRKTRLDRRLARFLSACSLDWRGARRAWRLNRAWADAFLAPMGLVDAGKHAAPIEDVRTAA